MNHQYGNIYFWKPEHEYGLFSNWYTSYISAYNIKFVNAEQLFMWKKQQLFDPQNHELEQRILNTNSPDQIKKLGRKVNNFDQELWDEKKYQIMVEVLMEKFSQNSDLKYKLIDTGDLMLVEASPYDKIWGIGLNEFDAKTKTWQGENLLGKALMEVRDILIYDE